MNIELDLINAIRDGIREAVTSKLKGYNGPLDKLIESSIAANSEMLKSIMEEAFGAIGKGAIREQMVEALNHKLAKVLVSKMEGEIEKRTNDFRSDPAMRARLTLAIEEIVKGGGK